MFACIVVNVVRFLGWQSPILSYIYIYGAY